MSEAFFCTSSELAALLTTKNLIVLDCRAALTKPTLGEEQYAAGHIPGAHYMHVDKDMASPVGPHGGRHPLPNEATLVAKLRGIGMCSNSTVVVYDDFRFFFAARMWWLLRYYGHRNVRLLDGGFTAWKNAGHPVTADLPVVPAAGDFEPQRTDRFIVDRSWILQWMNSPPAERPVLIDSRDTPRYEGTVEPIDRIAGHIPGAICKPWKEFTTEDGFVISAEANKARWSFLPPEASPIVYCGSGVTACVNFLSLHTAGFMKARIYAGSWSDYISYEDAKIATGLEP